MLYKGFDIEVAIIPPTGFVLGDVRMYAQSPRGKRAAKWFCSEAIADCLGYRDAWRYDPATLFAVLVSHGRIVQMCEALKSKTPILA